MHSRSLILGLAAVGAALLAAAPAKAVTLTSLLGTGQTLVSGNATFSNFVYGGTTPASSVAVNTSATGLTFSTNTGGWTTPNGSSIIQYDVSFSGGNIEAVGLSFSASVTGSATASVGETVTDRANNKDYNLQVFTDGAGPLPDSDTASVTLNPTTNTLHVVKSIDVATNGGTATITLVDNTFTQSGGAGPGVPEPMSLALLPLGIAGLALRKKFAR